MQYAVIFLQAGTLIAMSSLYLTNSNVIAGPLWPVPSEERSKIRMLFYYACCPAGCLWSADQADPRTNKPNKKRSQIQDQKNDLMLITFSVLCLALNFHWNALQMLFFHQPGLHVRVQVLQNLKGVTEFVDSARCF